jgi:hypothetical protein
MCLEAEEKVTRLAQSPMTTLQVSGSPEQWLDVEHGNHTFSVVRVAMLTCRTYPAT